MHIKRKLFNHCGAAAVLLSVLKKCGKLNTNEAFYKYGVYDLSVASTKLKQMGYKVKKRNLTVNGKKVTEYFMREYE